MRGADGKVRDYTAGRDVPRDGQVRIGSNTKTFTAVVVLQLVGEGKIDLDGTVEHYLPDQRIAGRHPKGYVAVAPDAPWIDVTRMDPSLGWAAGQLISTPSELRAFDEALIGGKLLKPAQQAEMLKTVPAPDFEPTEGWEYGLGIAGHALPCGGYAWGHGGDIQGFETRNLVTTDGRSAVVAVTALPTKPEMTTNVSNAVDAALCF